MVKSLINRFKTNKEAKNASWIIGGKVIQMLISLVVGLITARYLGPANYGLINYANAYIAFFTSLCNLGINSVIVKNFVDHPEEEGETLGTSILLKFLSSTLSCIIIFLIVSVADAGETETILVVLLSSISVIFNIFSTLNYWFQSRYLAKRTAVTALISYMSVAVYKIILLVTGKSVLWFAFSMSVDYIAYAIIIFLFYKKEGGPKFSVSLSKAKELLNSSYHFILSGLMVAVYGYTDKFMLKQMLDSESVGYYSTATAICSMWTFVLTAIIDSVYPTIMNLHKTDKIGFERKNRQLYAIVFYVSVAVSVCFTLFGNIVINILYGAKFAGAVGPLRVVTWYTAFSFLGVARNAWIVCENKQKYLKYMYICAAVINICLNLCLIPIMGATGAALASLITEICTSIILPLIFKGMRTNAKLILQAILLKDVFGGQNVEERNQKNC